MFRVFTTKEFDIDFDGLDESDKQRVRKIMKQLKEQPFSGKSLGLPYFREKKFDGKRLYFLIYKTFMVVLAVGISDKRAQQATINKILRDLDTYQEFIIKELDKLKD